MAYPPLPVDKQFGDWFPNIPPRGVPTDESSKEIEDTSLALQSASKESSRETLSGPKKIKFGVIRVWVSGLGLDSKSFDDGPSFDLKGHDLSNVDDETEDAFCLAPGSDEKNVKIRGLIHGTNEIKSAKLELFCRGHAEPIWAHHWGDAWGKKNEEISALPIKYRHEHTDFFELDFSKVQVDKSLKLEDRTGEKNTAFPKGQLTLAHSPYQLRMTVSGCESKDTPPDGDKFAYPMTSWTYLHVAVHSFKYSFGELKWLADKRDDIHEDFKKTIVGERKGEDDYGLEGAAIEELKKFNSEPKDSSLHLVPLTVNHSTQRNRVKGDNGELKIEDTANYEKMWGQGTRIPLVATPRIRSLNGQPVDENVADIVQGASLMWDWEDPEEERWKEATKTKDNIGDGEKTREFLHKLHKRPSNEMYPLGASACPKDRGGKLGDDSASYFLPQDKAGDGNGSLPFQVKALTTRKWAAESLFDDKGNTGVLFQPARTAGDAYKIKTFLMDESLDKKDKLEDDVSALGSPGIFEVCRRLTIHHLVVGSLPGVDVSQMTKTAKARARSQAWLDLDIKTTKIQPKDYAELMKSALKLAAKGNSGAYYNFFGLDVLNLLKADSDPGSAFMKLRSRSVFEARIKNLFEKGKLRLAKVKLDSLELSRLGIVRNDESMAVPVSLGEKLGDDPVVYYLTEPDKDALKDNESGKGFGTEESHTLKLLTKATSCWEVTRTFKNTDKHKKHVMVTFPKATKAVDLDFKRSGLSGVSSELSEQMKDALRAGLLEASEAHDDSAEFKIQIEGHRGTSSSSKARIKSVETYIDDLCAQNVIIERKRVYEKYLEQSPFSKRVSFMTETTSTSLLYGHLTDAFAQAYAEKNELTEGQIVVHSSRVSSLTDAAEDRREVKFSQKQGKYLDFSDYPAGGSVDGAMKDHVDLGLIYLVTPDAGAKTFAQNLKGRVKESWAIFLHELGHGLCLQHANRAPGRQKQIGAGSVVASEHVDNESCLMSYDAKSNQFCGLCMLRLRGWKWDDLATTLPKQVNVAIKLGDPNSIFEQPAFTDKGFQARMQVLGLFNRPLGMVNDEHFEDEFNECWEYSKKLGEQILSGLKDNREEVLTEALQEYMVSGGEIPASDKQARLRIWGHRHPLYANMDMALRYGNAATKDAKENAFKMMAILGDVKALYEAQNQALGAYPLEVLVTEKDGGTPVPNTDVYLELITPKEPKPFNPDAAGTKFLGGTSYIDTCGRPELHAHVAKYEKDKIYAHDQSDSDDPQANNVHAAMGGKRKLNPDGDVVTRSSERDLRNVFSPPDAWISNFAHHMLYATHLTQEPPKHPETGEPLKHTVKLKTDEHGAARVMFTPSTIAGDSYRLRAYVSKPGDLDHVLGECESGDMVLWQTMRIQGYYQMQNVKNTKSLPASVQKRRKATSISDSKLFRPLSEFNLRKSIGDELAKAYCEVIFEDTALEPQKLDKAYWKRFFQYTDEFSTKFNETELSYMLFKGQGSKVYLRPDPNDPKVFRGKLKGKIQPGRVAILLQRDDLVEQLSAAVAHAYSKDADPTAKKATFTALKENDQIFGMKEELGDEHWIIKAVPTTYEKNGPEVELEAGSEVDYESGDVVVKFKDAIEGRFKPKWGSHNSQDWGELKAVTGASQDNTDNGVLWAKISEAWGSRWNIRVYKDERLTKGSLVAQASRVSADQKDVQCTSKNRSGLTITLDVGPKPTDGRNVMFTAGVPVVFAIAFPESIVDPKAIVEPTEVSSYLLNIRDTASYNEKRRPNFPEAPPGEGKRLTPFEELVGAKSDYSWGETYFMRALSAATAGGQGFCYYPGQVFIQSNYYNPMVKGLGGKGVGNTALIFMEGSENARFHHYLVLHEMGHCLFGVHAYQETPPVGYKNSFHDCDHGVWRCIMGDRADIESSGSVKQLDTFCGKCLAGIRGLLVMEEPLYSASMNGLKHDVDPGDSVKVRNPSLDSPNRGLVLAPPAPDLHVATAPPTVEPQEDPSISDTLEGSTYLMLSSEDEANGDPGKYPDTFTSEEKHLVVMKGDRAAIKDTMDKIEVDAVLDLLVLNQAHGDHKLYSHAHWNGSDLKTNVVDPLVARGVKAKIIVLDFCLSGSLMPFFLDLLADDGKIVSAAYSTTALVANRQVWGDIKGELASRSVDNIWARLETQMKEHSALGTGLANQDRIRSVHSEIEIGQILRAAPGAKEHVSVIRYLHEVFNIMDEHQKAVETQSKAIDLGSLFDDLKAIKDNANTHAKDKALLAALPATKDLCTKEQYKDILKKLKARMIEVATEARFGIEESASLSGTPLFSWEDSECLGKVVWSKQSLILSKATGIPSCPTCFTVYTKSNKKIAHDAEMSKNAIPNNAKELLQTVEFASVDDVEKIVQQWKDDPGLGAATLDPKAKFLQS